ncbi:MAG: hypothetical protein IKD44_00380 [Lentisphaeria bacterium]|nr:hypothetical protein [Lentisphaeria bacterium]
MQLSFSQNIECPLDDSKRTAIMDMLTEEFKKISIDVKQDGAALTATGINASFGSILRNDVSTVTVTENFNKNGYIIKCDTEYKPSVAFWIFCVIDLVLITTIIGLIVGAAITLGLYFYNKSLVEKGAKLALENVKNNIG